MSDVSSNVLFRARMAHKLRRRGESRRMGELGRLRDVRSCLALTRRGPMLVAAFARDPCQYDRLVGGCVAKVQVQASGRRLPVIRGKSALAPKDNADV